MVAKDIEQNRNPLCLTSGPSGLRQHVNHNIKSARLDQCEGIFEDFEFPWKSVGKDKVVARSLLAEKESRALCGDKLNPGIIAKCFTGNGLHIEITVDGGQRGGRVHTREQPGRANTRSRPQLKHLSARLGCGQKLKQCPDTGLGDPVKSKLFRFGDKMGQYGRRSNAANIFHL